MSEEITIRFTDGDYKAAEKLARTLNCTIEELIGASVRSFFDRVVANHRHTFRPVKSNKK